MKETKRIQCKPADVDDTIKFYQQFGWELISANEVNNSHSHLERQDRWGNVTNDGSGDLYCVTETERYVNLLFHRSTKMPHYKKITKLEAEYYQLQEIERSNAYGHEKPNWGIKAAIIELLLGIGLLFSIELFGIGTNSSRSLIANVIVFGTLGLMALTVICKAATHRRKMEDYEMAQRAAKKASHRMEKISLCLSELVDA